MGISGVKDHMGQHGLNSRLKKDKLDYAVLLESQKIGPPRVLRGMKRDKLTGYYWNRVDEFIAKWKYGIDLSYLASVLDEANDDKGYVLSSVSSSHGFTRFAVCLPGKSSAVYVSVYRNDRGIKSILKVDLVNKEL